MLAPTTLARCRSLLSTSADLLLDLVAMIHDEIRWLVAEGATYIQFDAPYYSDYLDLRQREHMRQAGRDPERELEDGITGANAAFADMLRDHMTLALHVCRGKAVADDTPKTGVPAASNRSA